MIKHLTQAMIVVQFIIVGSISHAQMLSNKEMNELKGGTISSCYRTQRAAPINSILSDAHISRYCTCIANKIFNRRLSVNEVQTAVKIQQTRGNDAMLNYFLNGRDIYQMVEECSTQ